MLLHTVECFNIYEQEVTKLIKCNHDHDEDKGEQKSKTPVAFLTCGHACKNMRLVLVVTQGRDHINLRNMSLFVMKLFRKSAKLN